MNKSFITNSIAIILIVVGHFMASSLIFTIGLFAFSGAITNWLAIHMLFEKVPGLYGSGVIPARFEDFKNAICNMKESLIEMTSSEEFDEILKSEMQQPEMTDDIRTRISEIIEQRLNELTPQMVKEIVQEMIKKHLG